MKKQQTYQYLLQRCYRGLLLPSFLNCTNLGFDSVFKSNKHVYSDHFVKKRITFIKFPFLRII